MKKILILLFLLVFVFKVEAAVPSRTYTYTSGNTISPSEVTTNEDNIFSYLSAGVEAIAANTVVSADIVDETIVSADIADETITTSDIKDGTIANADISSSAAIVGSKLDLSAPGAIGGTTAATGSFTTLSATGLFTLTGGQIAFPATQSASTDANTLDDYEEGTWTPGISFGGGTTGITYTQQTGYYTKIGNVVSISGTLTLSAKGSSTGTAAVTGLPFTVVNNAAGSTASALYFSVVTFANQIQGYADTNTTTITLREITEAGAVTTITNGDFADTSVVVVGIVYRVN